MWNIQYSHSKPCAFQTLVQRTHESRDYWASPLIGSRLTVTAELRWRCWRFEVKKRRKATAGRPLSLLIALHRKYWRLSQSVRASSVLFFFSLLLIIHPSTSKCVASLRSDPVIPQQVAQFGKVLRCTPAFCSEGSQHKGPIMMLLREKSYQPSTWLVFTFVPQVSQRCRRSTAWRNPLSRAITSLWPAWLRAASPLPTSAGSGTRRRSKVKPDTVFSESCWCCRCPSNWFIPSRDDLVLCFQALILVQHTHKLLSGRGFKKKNW